MLYSQETLQKAFSANESITSMYRDFVSVEDAIESQEVTEAIEEKVNFESFTDH
jgi:hypothetical protein